MELAYCPMGGVSPSGARSAGKSKLDWRLPEVPNHSHRTRSPLGPAFVATTVIKRAAGFMSDHIAFPQLLNAHRLALLLLMSHSGGIRAAAGRGICRNPVQRPGRPRACVRRLPSSVVELKRDPRQLFHSGANSWPIAQSA